MKKERKGKKKKTGDRKTESMLDSFLVQIRFLEPARKVPRQGGKKRKEKEKKVAEK